MSVRGSFTTPLFTGLCFLCSSSALWGGTATRPAAGSASQPAVVVVKSPATAPADVGVVRTALRRLATIPRPGTELPETPSPQAKGSPSPVVRNNGSVRASPAVKPVQKAKPIAAAGQSGGQQPQAEQVQPGQQPVAPGQPIPGPGYVYPAPTAAPYVYVPPPTYTNRSDREWSNYRYFGGQPWSYGYGPNYGGGDYWGDSYRFGFMSGYDYGRFVQTSTDRQETVMVHALDAMDKGLKFFKEGKYRQAIDAFKLAAETNQGDPAARIYAAHAMFATGRYREAMPFLKRAFELQPKLALLDYDMRGDYARPADFEAQVRSLESALAQSPSSVERLIMLGYVRFYSGQKDAAYDPLAKAKHFDPANSIPDRLLPHCAPPDVVLDRQKTAAAGAASGRR